MTERFFICQYCGGSYLSILARNEHKCPALNDENYGEHVKKLKNLYFGVKGNETKQYE